MQSNILAQKRELLGNDMELKPTFLRDAHRNHFLGQDARLPCCFAAAVRVDGKCVLLLPGNTAVLGCIFSTAALKMGKYGGVLHISSVIRTVHLLSNVSTQLHSLPLLTEYLFTGLTIMQIQSKRFY